MTSTLWIAAAAMMVASFALGAVTASRWGHREHRWHTVLGVVYAVIGMVALVDILRLDYGLRHTVACDAALITVLRDRSDARQQVDATTRDAQHALTLVLRDLGDGVIAPGSPDVEAAVKAEDAAAVARETLDRQLVKPYPDCR